jgi:hypothetical protein
VYKRQARQVHADLRQKHGTLSKRVTAPSATESRVLLETMAFDLASAKANGLSNISTSSMSKHADLVVDTQAATAAVVGSATGAGPDMQPTTTTTTREYRMMTRSPPPVTRIVHATQVIKQKNRQQHLIASDSNLLTSKSTPTLSTWQSASANDANDTATQAARVSTNQTEQTVHNSNYQMTIGRYQQEVSSRIKHGALTAAGIYYIATVLVCWSSLLILICSRSCYNNSSITSPTINMYYRCVYQPYYRQYTHDMLLYDDTYCDTILL